MNKWKSFGIASLNLMFWIILCSFYLKGEIVEDSFQKQSLQEQKLLYLELETQDNLRSLTDPKDNFPNKFILISLGKNCEVAYQFKRAKLCDGFFPFDWMRSYDFDLVIELIKNKFKDFLKIDALQIIGQSGAHHVLTHIPHHA